MDVKRALYRILDLPAVYLISRPILACGANRLIPRQLAQLASEQGHPGRTLDIGCGPSSYLSRVGWSPIGLDINSRYVRELSRRQLGVVGSSTNVPFKDGAFQTVCTIGLLHHLADELVAQTLLEMLRVCSPGGRLVIIDAVPPVSALWRPLAHCVRRMDRGEFVRSEAQLRTLLESVITSPLKMERFTITYTGLECLCVWGTRA